MRLHLDHELNDARLCLAAIIVVMLLTAGTILYLGASYSTVWQGPGRILLASPL